LNAVALSYLSDKNFPVINIFNDYAKEHNIDISIKIDIYTPLNSTTNTEDFGSEIEYLLKKKKNKYDIILYDTIYSPRYAPYFIDLKDYIPKEHIDLYSSTFANQTCTYQGKWFGLVS